LAATVPAVRSASIVILSPQVAVSQHRVMAPSKECREQVLPCNMHGEIPYSRLAGLLPGTRWRHWTDGGHPGHTEVHRPGKRRVNGRHAR
jgi:hypothetical protein